MATWKAALMINGELWIDDRAPEHKAEELPECCRHLAEIFERNDAMRAFICGSCDAARARIGAEATTTPGGELLEDHPQMILEEVMDLAGLEGNKREYYRYRLTQSLLLDTVALAELLGQEPITVKGDLDPQ